MDYRTFAAELRSERKKGPIGRLRRSGRIPAVIYGHTENTPITLDEHEFMMAFDKINESMILNVTTGDKDWEVLMKTFDEDLRTGRVMHVDFYAIERGKLLRAHAPVHTVGSAIGAREGGIFEVPLHEIEIECLPKDIPEAIVVDVSELQIHQSLHVREIEPPQGVTILSNPDQVVAQVLASRVEVDGAETEEEEELDAEGAATSAEE